MTCEQGPRKLAGRRQLECGLAGRVVPSTQEAPSMEDYRGTHCNRSRKDRVPHCMCARTDGFLSFRFLIYKTSDQQAQGPLWLTLLYSCRVIKCLVSSLD